MGKGEGVADLQRGFVFQSMHLSTSMYLYQALFIYLNHTICITSPYTYTYRNTYHSFSRSLLLKNLKRGVSLECRISPPWNIFSPVASSLCVGSLESEKQPPYHLLSLSLPPPAVSLPCHSSHPLNFTCTYDFCEVFWKIGIQLFFLQSCSSKKYLPSLWWVLLQFYQIIYPWKAKLYNTDVCDHIGELLDFFKKWVEMASWEEEK